MIYVEWLRVRKCLKILAIVFAVMFVLAVVLRIWAFAAASHDTMAWIHGVELDSTSHVVRSTLPDGTRRVVIDNAKQDVHIVIDDHGYQGKHIEILERSPGKSGRSHVTVSMGPVDVETIPTSHGSLTIVDTNKPEDFAYYAGIATFVALIVATIIGAPFARENDGHLEIALTKPISREAFALRTIGIDAVGLLASWIMTVVFLAIVHSLFEAPHYRFGAQDAVVTAGGLLAIAAWYAMLCAATASLKRAYGVILGLAWPVSLVVYVLAKVDLSGSTIGEVIHAIATPLSWIDPFTYVHFGPAYVKNGAPSGSMAVVPYHDLPALAILALVYGALAIVQWRRVEA